MSNTLRISASSLKALTDCTMAFYYDRILKLPQKQWPRTIIGSLVHSIFECLRNPRHRKHYDLIVHSDKQGVSYQLSTPLARLVNMWQEKYTIEQDLLTDLNELLHVGLNCIDFHWSAADLDPVTGARRVYGPEHAFHMKLADGVEVKGFIDDMAVVNGVMNVRDFKSAKNKPSMAELPNNVQALTYQAYCWLTFGLPARVEFVYLRHGPTKRTPTKHLQIVEPASPTVIAGFLDYVSHIYGRINQFTLEDALQSPHEDIFFCQRVCTHYAPHPYWVLCKADDPKGLSPLSSHLSVDKAQEACDNAANGSTILERYHKGCMSRWKESS